MPTEPEALQINPQWRIEREPASLVFLVFADAIMGDPKLKGRVKTWIVPERMNPDGLALAGRLADPEFRITDKSCPVVTLWPEARDGQERDSVSQQATLTVRVGIVLPGLNPLDALDYWGRIQRSVLRQTLPGGERLAVRLHDAGSDGSPVRIDQPAVLTEGDRDAGFLQVARGSFSQTYRIPEGD